MLQVLKFCLPIIWHYKFDGLAQKEILDFVPEGIENCAELVFEDSMRLRIWKCEVEKGTYDWRGRLSEERKFELQWCPSFLFEVADSTPYKWMNKTNCESLWEDVLKKNMFGINKWDRTSITEITEYLDEVSKLKLEIAK